MSLIRVPPRPATGLVSGVLSTTAIQFVDGNTVTATIASVESVDDPGTYILQATFATGVPGVFAAEASD